MANNSKISDIDIDDFLDLLVKKVNEKSNKRPRTTYEQSAHKKKFLCRRGTYLVLLRIYSCDQCVTQKTRLFVKGRKTN